ncbi:hypothetical protein H072_364 [Dactylellina haptotyla CBS 200.50]|uniref:Zinc finger PHD-type domain-containing protein n=1 Tax=Dactylellina haptotyla (strain CBS 200.50) TaxID=1284197 RepID=S8CD93_DACHA|nr:hypothetical protein H072_364 [Dactylellina haptotyla CBS 200.50]
MSPRRSSRARSAAHHGNSHTSNSSHSSTSSTRRARKSRYAGGDSHSVTRAESYDEIEEPVDEDMEDNYSGAEEEEGETRCVCGFKEYQGGSDDSHTDLTDGLFIQCDQCHVWQHGLCVGIRDKALAPDNYFCEQCKPENHTLYEKKGGRTYSTYIGFGPERIEVAKDLPQKRRSTMNSRDAAYDEQILHQVLEQSKLEDKKTGPRSRKRGTSETSDEHHTKRQRTSDSPEKAESVHAADDGADKSNSSSSRKARNGRASASASAPVPASSTQPSSSTKRSSGRSRGDRDNRRDGTDTPTQVTLVTHADIIIESEQSEEPPRPTRNTVTSTKAEEPLPVIATPSLEVTESPMNKRRQRRRGGTRGTRASEDPGENSSHAMARDASAQGTDTNGVHDRPAKPRLPNSRTTIQEMRRRVTGISDFIAKTQVEMVGQKQRTTVFGALVSATAGGALNADVLFNLLDQNRTPNSGGQSATSTPTSGLADKVTVVTDKPEAEPLAPTAVAMSSTELMDFLMKKVNHWELTYNRQIERVH